MPSFGPPIKTLPISRILRHRLVWASVLKNLCVDFKTTNLILDRSILLIPYDSQIKLRLKIKPKIRSRSERISEPKSHLRRDTALLLDDIVDAWSRNVQSQCQLIMLGVSPGSNRRAPASGLGTQHIRLAGESFYPPSAV